MGVEVTKRRRLPVIAVATFLVAVPLTGCAAEDQPRVENLPVFSSIDEAYAAVDDILDCEPDPVGEPTVPMGDGVRLTSAQKLCFENVQIDLYVDQNALQESYQILSDTNQGKIHLVHGKNWMVVDFSQMATGRPSTRNIERLANELNGEYAIVGV
jgi:hypothetical protein